MKSKKLALSLNLVIILAIVFGFILPCTFVGCKADVAYAATSTAKSAADWTPTYSGNYYNGISANLTGKSLRTQVSDLITDTHKTYTTYDGLANAFKTADADPDKNGNIIWFYTGTSASFKGFGGSVGDTNREHVWPKDGGDAFPEKSGPGSDAHHLRPTETQLNSTRGSKSFDEVPMTPANLVKENGRTDYPSKCYSTSTFFYPGEGYRGATARILFYMQTRWGDTYNLTFVDSAGHTKTIGKISTLMKWHLQEPPTDEEIRRNEAVYKLQGNRNPFIDHPEYAAAIYCNDGQSYNNALKQVVAQYGDYNQDRPDLESLALTPNTLSLTIGATQTLTVQATPANANANVKWTSSNTSVATVNNGVVTAASNGNAVITATSVTDATIKATANVTVKKATSIELIGSPTVTQYQQGQTFNPAGLSVKITYDDGTFLNVTSANDLKQQFQWLDADTGQQMLTVGTTKIKCKYGEIEQVGNWTVTVTAPPENISGFIDKVSAVNNAATLRERFDAIKEAFAAYNQLTSTEKSNASAVGAYETLQQAAAKYNSDVASNNEVMQNATKTGAYAVCGVTLAAVALIVVLNRKFS